MRAASAPDGRARTCLLTTCGLPGAGKSTLARAVAKRAEGDGTRVTLVSFDEVERRLLSAKSKANGETPPPQVGFDAYVWKAARVEALGTVRTLLTDNRERHETTEEDVPKPTREEDDPGNTKCPYAGTHLVIADDNFYYAGMRRRCHRAAVAVGAAHVTLYVATSVANAHARNELRTPDEVVPIHALNRMADAFEAPVETRTEEKEYEENSRPFHKKGKEKETEPEKTTRPNGVNVFERGTVVCVSAADMASFRDEEDKWHVDVGKVWERIQKKWVGPATLAGASENEIAERRGSGAAANASSATHGLDIRSRKTLAECMCCSAVRADGTGKDGAALGALSKKLNLARREMVDRFRTAAKRFSEDVCDVSGTSINSRNEQDEDTDDLDAEIAFVAEMAKSELEFIELCRAAGVGGG